MREPEAVTGVEVTDEGEVDEEAIADMEEQDESATAGEKVEDLKRGSRQRPIPR